MPVNTAPSVSDRISEEFEEMRRLRAHYGPGLCSKGSDTVFEATGVRWIWGRDEASTIVRGMLGTKSHFRLGTTEPRVYATATCRRDPLPPSHGPERAAIPFFAQPLVVAQRREDEIEVGVSIRRVNFRLVLPERLGQRPYYDCDRTRSERVGVVALTVTASEDGESTLVRRRTIAGEGYNLFDEYSGGRIVEEGQYLASPQRFEAVMTAFRDSVWNSVSEPA